ncbi:SDR family NAD(P)-dependent oxidoreductase [Streptomyces sp. NPDC059477]|uniref:SDR family NAD(P)-dependent oxidoreductase n=1 Tax=Streptomyces sp. NPDC059477 TaxID=3346847 RepID=UPI00368C5DFF
MTGRRVLVTGARRGIGAALAVGLARPGTAVVLHHLDAAREIADVAAGCRDLGAAVEILEADLGDAREIARLASAAGPVDVLVNNAARASQSALDDLSDEEWASTLAVNLTAPVLLARALVPGMRARGWGRIVNITSATVRLGGPSGPAYVAGKSGLVGLTRALARSLGPAGITVNALSPGAVRTESERELATAHQPQHDLDADILRRQALPRRLTPDDMVGCLRFLVSEGAAGVTGQVIEVGGGLVHR